MEKVVNYVSLICLAVSFVQTVQHACSVKEDTTLEDLVLLVYPVIMRDVKFVLNQTLQNA